MGDGVVCRNKIYCCWSVLILHRVWRDSCYPEAEGLLCVYMASYRYMGRDNKGHCIM